MDNYVSRLFFLFLVRIYYWQKCYYFVIHEVRPVRVRSLIWLKYFYYSEPTGGYAMCADLHVTHYVDETFYITQVISLEGFSVTFRLGKCEGFYGKGLTPMFFVFVDFTWPEREFKRRTTFVCVCCSICLSR